MVEMARLKFSHVHQHRGIQRLSCIDSLILAVAKNTSMSIEKKFSSTYHLEVGGDLGAPASIYYFPGADRESGKDGVLVEVFNAKGENWTGVFAFGSFSPKGITGVYHLPDESRFCVVSKGDGYIVNANDPSDWQEISLIPILDVCLSLIHI